MLITNAVDAKTEFRIFRRRPGDNRWDSGSTYPRTNGIALIRALEKAKPWDGKSHAIAYGMLHAYEPGIGITIDWSRTKSERKTRSVAICNGNRLFWYRDSLYQISESSYELMDRLFPRNK